MTIKSAQKRHARPMIERNGGTHLVDLAVTNVSGMEKCYSDTDDNGDTTTTYRPSINDQSQRDPNRPGMAWPFGRSGGAGEVIVTEERQTDQDAYRMEDVQPEPGPSDGENQNAGGRQDDQDDSGSQRRPNAMYGRRLSQI